MADLEKQRAGHLEEKRGSLRKGLPPALLKRYEFIRQRHNGTAICAVREGVCLGCHLNILPQLYIDLQKGEEILQCPNCQRIVYWLGEEAEEEEEEQVKQEGPGETGPEELVSRAMATAPTPGRDLSRPWPRDPDIPGVCRRFGIDP